MLTSNPDVKLVGFGSDVMIPNPSRSIRFGFWFRYVEAYLLVEVKKFKYRIFR